MVTQDEYWAAAEKAGCCMAPDRCFGCTFVEEQAFPEWAQQPPKPQEKTS